MTDAFVGRTVDGDRAARAEEMRGRGRENGEMDDHTREGARYGGRERRRR